MVDHSVELLLDDLLEFIEDRRVVPIIGDELLLVPSENGAIPLYRHVAQRLAARLSIPADALPADADLNAVVCQHVRAGGLPEEIYPKIRTIMKETRVEPPEALLQLAQIDRIDLFVVLTFDSLLATAIDRIRFGGESRTVELAYTPKNVQDLPCEKDALRQPVVYHLLGRLSAQPDYVISEEDTLEFLHHMQSNARQAEFLFDALRDNHLLFIGCAFPDWLARFLIRIAKRRPLSLRRSEMELFVANDADADRRLVGFLRHFSPRTKVVSCPAADFVTELAARYAARNAGAATPAAPTPQPAAAAAASAAEAAAPAPALAAAAAPPAPTRPAPALSAEGGAADAPPAAMEPGAIFVSYAHEDHQAARRLRDFLEGEAGLDVWLDQRRLAAGDDYDQLIRHHIKNCSYFMPLISTAAMRRQEGYFRKEWALAADRAMNFADGVPFIVPVVVDETPQDTMGVPERFQRTHWTRLPDGAGDEEFRKRMVTLVRDYRKRARG